MSRFLFGYDFYYYWVVGKILHNGENPYKLTNLNHELTSIGWPAEEVAQGLTHPSSNLWLYWLFAMLPFQLSLVLWVCLSAVLSLFCGIAVTALLNPGKKSLQPFLIFATLTFPPFLSNIIWGQVNAILLLGITLYAYLIQKERMFLAGVGCSLVLFKPQSFIPFLCVISFYELKSLRFKVVLGILCGLLLQMFFSYCVSPSSFQWYLEYAPSVIRESSRICGSTVGQMLECEVEWSWIRPFVLILGVGASLLLTKIYGYSLSTLLVLVVPVSMLVSPYAWNHTFITLLPAYLYILTTSGSKISQRLLTYVVVGIAGLTIPIILNARIQYPWIALPLILLMLGMRLLRPQKS